VSNNSLLPIAKALKQIIVRNPEQLPLNSPVLRTAGLKLLTPFEEVQLVIEEIIISRSQTVDLLPQSTAIRKLQYELISHYQLHGVTIGQEPHRYIRIYPNFRQIV